MCTGAAVFNFLHRHGGFAKSWKFIALDIENAPSRKASTTDGDLRVLTEKVRQLHTESPRCLMCVPGFATNAFGTQFGRLSGSSRTLLGRLPDAPRTPPGRASDASRTRLGRLPDTPQTLFGHLPGSSQSRRCLLKLRCLPKLCAIRATSRGVNTYSSTITSVNTYTTFRLWLYPISA